MSLTLLIGITLLIGLLLGLLGGGGSILMVPVLVYLVGQEPKTAIATALVVVSITSLIAMISHARAGRVCWKNGAAFGLSGMLGAYGGGRLAAYVPGQILLLMFALIMLGTALSMLLGRRDRSRAPLNDHLCPLRINLPAALFDGFLVGAINGLLGVGGGFVIVPALNILGGLPIQAAIGTSLFIIGMNSIAALAGYISHVAIDFRLAAIITVSAIIGSLVGGQLTGRISATQLRKGFGLFIIGIALYLLYRELSWSALEEIQRLLEAHREFFRGLLTAVIILLLYWLRGLIHHRTDG